MPWTFNFTPTTVAILEDCYILINEKKISSMKDLLPILEQIAKMGVFSSEMFFRVGFAIIRHVGYHSHQNSYSRWRADDENSSDDLG